MKKVVSLIAASAALISMANAGGKILEPVNPEATVAPIAEESATLAPLYIGVGAVASFTEKDPCACSKDQSREKDTRYGVILRAGYDFSDYLGLEARYLKTFGSSAYSKVTHYGLFLKPQYYINDNFNVYALLGYGKTKLKYNNGMTTESLTKSGFSYGVGAEYTLEKRTQDGTPKKYGVWVDIQHLIKGEGTKNADANILSVGVTYDF